MVSHWFVEGAFPGVVVSVSFDCSHGSTSIDQVRACPCNQLAHPVPGASPQHELCCPFHGAARYPLECVAGPGVVDKFDEPDIDELDEPRAKSRR
jgi:hypothetical protein